MKKIKNIASLIFIISLAFYNITDVFSQNIAADKIKILSNKADSIFKKYYEYSTFSQNGMSISEGYVKKFKSLFTDDAVLYNDLDFENKSTASSVIVDDYIRNVKENYYGGLGVEISESKIGNPLLEKNNYKVLITGKKKVFGFHEVKGKFSNEFLFTINVLISSDFSNTKIISIINQNIVSSKPLPVKTDSIVAVNKPIQQKSDFISFIVKNDKGESLNEIMVIMKMNSEVIQQKYSKSNGEVTFLNFPIDGEIEIIAEDKELTGFITGKINELKNKTTDIIIKSKQTQVVHSITITLKDQNQEVISNAKIILKYDNEVKQKGLTNEKGEFVFTNIPAGTYVNIAAKTENETGNLNGKIDDLLTTNKVIIMKGEKEQSTSLSISLINSKSKQAVSNAKVRLLCDNKVFESTSDYMGMVIFKDIPKNKSLFITVSKEGYKFINQSLEKNNKQNLIIQMDASGNNNEMAIGIRLGNSSLNNNCFEIRDNIKYIKGSTIAKPGFGFYLSYSTKLLNSSLINVNIGTGFGLSRNSTDISIDSIFCSSKEIDSDKNPYIRNIYASDYSETFSFTSFDVPLFLLFKFNTKSRLIENIFINTGLQLSYIFSKNYVVSNENSFTYKGYYEDLHTELYNLPKAGFYNSKAPDSYKNIETENINTSFYARLGVSFLLSPKISFRPSFDYSLGLSNLKKTSNDFLLTNTRSYLYNDYNSILNYSESNKTLYYGINVEFIYKF
jgi:hypothetical protein